ncbi:MAG TPA: putative oxidoreductase C-terminal domain-containing protein [Vicinamibacteria bacterium]|nr:putative oxidoreductase C-terminal domain-containing protein [Vicinamibacteria bacterium]
MRSSVLAVVLAAGLAVSVRAEDEAVRLMTLDPGHFHAALIQKEMVPGVDATVHVYAPLGQDLLLHLGRVAAFNNRLENPTRWRLEVHAGPDARARMLREKPGNVVVLSGRNRTKIDDLLASVEAGLNVLADKPWIVEAAEFPKLERALDLAAKKQLVAYDIMTERSEITTILQRELLHDRAVVGTVGPGSAEAPAVEMESVHQLLKAVAGAVNLRPAWFFDTREQGEALADVGTHLVDLVQWMLYPDQAIDYRADLRVLSARRWPTVLDRAQLVRLTGDRQLAPSLVSLMQGERLDYFANGEVSYTLRGTHARLKVLWNYQAPEGGGDTHRAVVRGSRARLEILQGAEQRWRPELYVVPVVASEAGFVRAAVERRLAALAEERPGLTLQDEGGRLRVVIPDGYRVGHEAHFGQVTRRFLGYLKDPASLPRWEQANMLAKYWVTTQAVELSRRP